MHPHSGSECECDDMSWSSGGCWPQSDLETESEGRSSVSDRPQQRWQSVASAARSADRTCKMDALATVLPQLPDGPQGKALERALLHCKDLSKGLRAVEYAAWAMARAEELVAECGEV